MKRLVGRLRNGLPPVQDWMRTGLRRYFLWRYWTTKKDEPWLTALGVYNLQRRRNSSLRKGQAERAQQLEQDITHLLNSLGEQSPTSGHSKVRLVPEDSKSTRLLDGGREAYWVDAIFLARCWKWLVQGKQERAQQKVRLRSAVAVVPGPEWACLVTGLCIDGVRLLTEMVPVCYSHQSAGGVALEVADFHRALRGLQRWGYSLHAVFHSHRFSGRVSPSNIDLETQSRVLEPIYPAIQAVFSEDGYVRFFSVDRSFKLTVFGKGVERVGTHLYRLDSELLRAALVDEIWAPLVPTK